MPTRGLVSIAAAGAMVNRLEDFERASEFSEALRTFGEFWLSRLIISRRISINILIPQMLLSKAR
jgi:hypothetical protein